MSFVERLKEAEVNFCTIDIERKPALSYHWGLWKQNIGTHMITDPGGMISFSYKWYDNPEPVNVSIWEQGKELMLETLWAVLDDTDVLISYNGVRFDTPHMFTELALAGYTPPSPFKEVDLFQTAKRRFNLLSNKLDYVADSFGVGRKTETGGFDLWKKVMDGDPEAQAQMAAYNNDDVILTEKVYDRLKPWIPNHPHMGTYLGNSWACASCGYDLRNEDFEATYRTQVQTYGACACPECGHWNRTNVSTGTKLSTRSIK